MKPKACKRDPVFPVTSWPESFLRVPPGPCCDEVKFPSYALVRGHSQTQQSLAGVGEWQPSDWAQALADREKKDLNRKEQGTSGGKVLPSRQLCDFREFMRSPCTLVSPPWNMDANVPWGKTAEWWWGPKPAGAKTSAHYIFFSFLLFQKVPKSKHWKTKHGFEERTAQDDIV